MEVFQDRERKRLRIAEGVYGYPRLSCLGLRCIGVVESFIVHITSSKERNLVNTKSERDA